jgi:hypothetical protein
MPYILQIVRITDMEDLRYSQGKVQTQDETNKAVGEQHHWTAEI